MLAEVAMEPGIGALDGGRRPSREGDHGRTGCGIAPRHRPSPLTLPRGQRAIGEPGTEGVTDGRR